MTSLLPRDNYVISHASSVIYSVITDVSHVNRRRKDTKKTHSHKRNINSNA